MFLRSPASTELQGLEGGEPQPLEQALVEVLGVRGSLGPVGHRPQAAATARSWAIGPPAFARVTQLALTISVASSNQ